MPATNNIGTGSARRARFRVFAFVYVYASIERVTVESFRAYARIVSGGVLAVRVLAARIWLFTFVDI